MSDNSGLSQLSDKLAALRAQIKSGENMKNKCTESIEKDQPEMHLECAKSHIKSDVYAQRIIINSIVRQYHTSSKSANGVILELKALIKQNNEIVAFYLFLAELYRLHSEKDMAESALGLLECYNKTEEARVVKEKYISILRKENRVIKFEVSTDVSEFTFLSTITHKLKENTSLRRRASLRPIFRYQSSDEEDSNDSKKRKETNPVKHPTGTPVCDSEVDKENYPSINKSRTTEAVPLRIRSLSNKSVQTKSDYNHVRSLRLTNGNDYQILDKLGQGGFSKVYKCSDASGELKALKYVDLSRVDPASEAGLLNEIEHLKALRGERNIIHMFDYEVLERKLYIVLEYGELDIQKYLGLNRKNICNSDIKSLWQQMVQGVAVVHSKGIIHRDLKPCNFMICRGRVKLIDFGIANTISSDVTSMFTDMVGTINYMAPEQLLVTNSGSKSVKVGKWADSWSLGCILYLMAYRKLPFQEFNNHLQKMKYILDENYNIEFSSHSCLGLVAMLKICLNRKPKERLLPKDILVSFFYNEKIEDMLKYLDDDQFQNIYKTAMRLS